MKWWSSLKERRNDFKTVSPRAWLITARKMAYRTLQAFSPYAIGLASSLWDVAKSFQTTETFQRKVFPKTSHDARHIRYGSWGTWLVQIVTLLHVSGFRMTLRLPTVNGLRWDVSQFWYQRKHYTETPSTFSTRYGIGPGCGLEFSSQV